MAGNSRRSQWLGSLAAGTLAALATFFVWQAGSENAAKDRNLSYLDHAAAAASGPAASMVADKAPAPAAPAKLPRATGVANGSYDTKVDGATFVFGAPASSSTKVELRFGPVVVTSGDEVLSGGNIGEYDVANGGFEAKRGGVAERYMYDNSRVEQLFVIPTKPEAPGAIEVASPVAMTSAGKVEVVGYGWHDARFEKGGLRVLDGAGAEVAAIYGARVVDAEGRQQDLALGYRNGAMTMTVPASFVAIATFPITVDPWIELDFSGTTGIAALPAGTLASARLAYSGAGTPIVGVTNAAGDVAVAAFNSGTGAWSGFGGTTAIVPPSAPASTINDLACPASLNPVVVWTEAEGADDEIYLARWNGVAWVGLGGSLGVGGLTGTASDSIEARVALDATGNPIVAWLELVGGVFEVYLRRFDGTFWVPMGTNPITLDASDAGNGISGTPAASAPQLDLAIDPLGRPVVVWTEIIGLANQIFLRRYNPATDRWEEIAGSGTGTGLSSSPDSCGGPSLAFDAAGEPMVAYAVAEAADFEIYLKHYDSLAGAWVGIGGSAAVGGLSADSILSTFPSLGVNASGVPTVAWRAGAAGGDEIYARRFNGTTWAELEGSASGSAISAAGAAGVFDPSLAMRPDGYPGVAWVDGSTTPVLFRQYDGIPVPTAATQTQVTAPFVAIATGGTSATGSVRLAATIPAGIPTAARLQVEIQPTGTGFTGVPTAESSLLAPGTTAAVIVPLTAGSYEWQYRVQAADPSIVCAYTEFVAGGATDFNIGTTPAAPLAADLSQHHLDTGVAIASGGTTLSGGAIFRYTPSGALPEALRLQIDFTGDGTVDVESPLNPMSSTAVISIPVPLPIAAYSWTARLTNAAGVQSTATAFTGGPTDFSVIATPAPTTSASLSLPTQTRTSLVAIAAGGVTPELMVVLGATITNGGATAELVRLQFDVEPTGLLDLDPDFETPLVSVPAAGSVTVTYTIPVGEGSYEWAVRAQNSLLVNTVYTAGTASSPDFSVDSPFAGPPPAAPTTLGQFFLDGTTPILVGGSTLEGAVTFRATLPASSDMVRLQVEVQTEAAAFTGFPDAESPLVPGGTTVDLTVPIGIASYKWQVRTVNSALATSAYVEFTAGAGPDFISPSTPTVPPAAPAAIGLAQKNLDGTVIASGGTAFSNTVLFEAVVPGLVTDFNRIQFDIESISVGPDGVPDIESPLVAGGSTVSVAVPLGVASYMWFARAIGPTGLTSAYTAFGPFFGTDFIVATGSSVPPTAPVTLAQKNLDGSSIASGGTAAGGSVVFEIVVPGAATELNRVQVDVEPTASPLDGQPDAECPLVAGGTTVQITVPFGVGAYNWAARTQSSLGLNSGWTAFPGGPSDFVVATGGALPTAPASLAQENPDGSAIGSGGTAAGSIVVFEVLVPGAATDLGRIQVDVETTGAGLDGIPDVESSLVAGGTIVSISVPLADGTYNWQARSQSASGANSSYTVFAGGPPDFVILTGSTPPAAPSAPVTMGQLNLDLSAIPSGGTVAGNLVVFQVLVPGAGTDLNRIQVSYAAGAPDTTPELESPLVTGGSTVTLTAPLAAGSYNWQARTMSSFDLSSGYTAFAGGPADFIVVTGGAAPTAPLPGAMSQQNPDATPIASGGTATGSIVVFSVTVPGLASDINRVQIDVEAGALDSIPDVESPLVAGGTIVTVSVPFANGSYNWQARTQNVSGAVSAFTAFAGGPADFVVDTTAPAPPVPGAPVALSMDQQNLDGSSIAASGGTALSNEVVFEVVVPGIPADLNRIQVDVESTGSLDGVVNCESPLVPGGSTVHIQASFANGSYEWQARTQSSLMVNSGFTAFTGGPTDFVWRRAARRRRPRPAFRSRTRTSR